MIVAENLVLRLGNQEIFRVDKLALARGEVLALVGPNGAGKTSLLLTLALLQKPTAGTVRFDGETANRHNLLALRRRLAVVFQEPLLLDTTVWGNVTTALRIRGVPRREANARAQKWLERFGIAHLARRPARHLSGGEAQRTSLARAFALEPEVLFLDEPFAALDLPTRNALLGELGRSFEGSGRHRAFCNARLCGNSLRGGAGCRDVRGADRQERYRPGGFRRGAAGTKGVGALAVISASTGRNRPAC